MKLMTDTIVLFYERVPVDLSTGSIMLITEDRAPFRSNPDRHLVDFHAFAYVPMLSLFAKYLLEYPEAHGAIQRIDRPGLIRIDLADDEVKLFREDPVEAIRRRTFETQVIHVGPEKIKAPEETVSMVPPLDAGYDARVECFGDVVFLRVNKQKEVECACCGAWAKTLMLDNRFIYRCECGAWLTILDWKPDLRWAGVGVFDLLGCKEEKYFLPRQWNTDGNWIARNKLGEMFLNYTEEKQKASHIP